MFLLIISLVGILCGTGGRRNYCNTTVIVAECHHRTRLWSFHSFHAATVELPELPALVCINSSRASCVGLGNGQHTECYLSHFNNETALNPRPNLLHCCTASRTIATLAYSSIFITRPFLHLRLSTASTHFCVIRCGSGMSLCKHVQGMLAALRLVSLEAPDDPLVVWLNMRSEVWPEVFNTDCFEVWRNDMAREVILKK